MRSKLVSTFRQIYHDSPQFLVQAPGRVNLIGDHTDYHDGFVLPLAIDFSVQIALTPIPAQRVSLFSMDYNQPAEINLDEIQSTNSGWVEYIKGTTVYIHKSGFPLHGWKGVISSDLPIGAGVSSSAALEMATIQAFMAAGNYKIDRQLAAQIGQTAENEWLGVNCGIMDQLTSSCGIKDHALFIDCRSLDITPIRLPPDCQIAILDTGTRRELTNSMYNTRLKECQSASDFFQINTLRELDIDRLLPQQKNLAHSTYKRALHVVTENNRVQKVAGYLTEHNLSDAGNLLYESHESLRDNYDVSTPALNAIVDCAVQIPGCYGARLTGAGFGGCAVALVSKESALNFESELKKQYLKKTGLSASVTITSAAPGAEIQLFEGRSSRT